MLRVYRRLTVKRFNINRLSQINFSQTTNFRDEVKDDIDEINKIQSYNNRLLQLKEINIPTYQELEPSFKKEVKVEYKNEVYNIKFNDISNLNKLLKKLETKEKLKQVNINLVGRIINKRSLSNKLVFYTLLIEGNLIQLMASLNEVDVDKLEFESIHNNLKKGDIVGVSGFIGKTKTDEPTVFLTDLPHLLTPNLKEIMEVSKFEKSSSDYQLRNRCQNLIVDNNFYKTIKNRIQVTKLLRNYLDKEGFEEVETNILDLKIGGANAKPFFTQISAFDNIKVGLRVATELNLKRMVVAGFPKIFELGKVFRNEGVDKNHNPEFTTLELYWAYANLEDLFNLTQNILRHVLSTINGSLKVQIADQEIDLQPEFNRIDVLKTLVEELGPLPSYDSHVDDFIQLLTINKIPINKPYTIPRLLDQAISHLIEPRCVQPTFLYNHPSIMSPLAQKDGLGSLRFELFINKMELINAYKELANPITQLDNFIKQSQDRTNLLDLEAHPVDLDFCNDLALGLPPTVGWGLGVDRLVMLVNQATTLRDTLTFPIVKPKN